MSARHNRTPLHRLTTRHTLNALQHQRGDWSCALAYSATRYWPSNATALRIEVVGPSVQWLKHLAPLHNSRNVGRPVVV